MSLVYGLSTPLELLSKLRRAENRLTNAISDEDDIAIGDAIYDFAVTGYHLRDWVAKGTNLRAEVNAFVDESPLLHACRDICNSSKHFEIDRYMPKTKDVYFSASPLRETELKMKWAIKILMSDGQKFEVAQFASQIVTLWEQFFDRFDLGTGT